MSTDEHRARLKILYAELDELEKDKAELIKALNLALDSLVCSSDPDKFKRQQKIAALLVKHGVCVDIADYKGKND